MANNEPTDYFQAPLGKPPSRNPTPSPRISHFDGEIPPALSPLDAFALQGRLLARQLDESNKKGERRMSRLPPASVARSLSQPRPGYFRSPSSGDSHRTAPVSPGARGHSRNREVEEPTFRPKSQHPVLSRHNPGFDPDSDNEHTPDVPPVPTGGFGMPRAGSPDEPVAFHSDIDNGQPIPGKRSPTGLGVSSGTQDSPGSLPPKRSASNTLAPPSSSALRPNGSPGGPQQESSDDDYYTSSTAGSTFSKPRKLSSSSGVSMPYSPMSHFTRPHARSPSPASENSTMPNALTRPPYNFSRPLSRSNTSISMPSPAVSTPEPPEEPQSRTMSRGNRPPPITVPNSSDSATNDAQSSAPASYIYAKYTLPRGRSLTRNSNSQRNSNSHVFSGLQTPHFEWNEPLFESSPPPSASGRERFEQTPSPPATSHAHPPASPSPLEQESPLKQETPSKEERWQTHAPSPKQDTPSSKKSPGKLVKRPDRPPQKRHSFDHGTREILCLGKKGSSSKLSVTPSAKDQDDAKTTSGDSNATLRPHTSRSGSGEAPPSTLSPEDHVAKGIECHENGSLNESTYHLRIAAMQNNPTGMLLYALACRHGWGMRPNQREGVQWLRKAVDSATLEASNSEPRGRNKQEEKARQAQFALSIYELGVSHLNGWGIEQDKTLALRCFEIAGHWGDVDALAEAGFCYVEGVGCKKDLKKAAKYYRMAESKGMSMVGNSWIYKPKYMSDDDTMPPAPPSLNSATTQEKKPRNKSRTRSIFGRKKSTAANSVHNDS
ncbi:hypothetical protein AJ79_06331 [Helicocarpus griseus UAMH5409]|uniref:Cell cycle inhibitor Nif1 n=1 Tax=Helicocarpus griseus UAMH5409 TaxID=1447875 RepID=A0A2B7XEZ2_9EURO|nr:hypothetical protein AJ79_06331 [Helicocarpus griseus UAMH5409]